MICLNKFLHYRYLKNNYLEIEIVKLDGKVTLITDESESIDLTAFQCFVAEGAYVFITKLLFIYIYMFRFNYVPIILVGQRIMRWQNFYYTSMKYTL
jgi:hypothetical protein